MRASEMWIVGKAKVEELGTVPEAANKFLRPNLDETETLFGLLRAAWLVGYRAGKKMRE